MGRENKVVPAVLTEREMLLALLIAEVFSTVDRRFNFDVRRINTTRKTDFTNRDVDVLLNEGILVEHVTREAMPDWAALLGVEKVRYFSFGPQIYAMCEPQGTPKRVQICASRKGEGKTYPAFYFKTGTAYNIRAFGLRIQQRLIPGGLPIPARFQRYLSDSIVVRPSYVCLQKENRTVSNTDGSADNGALVSEDTTHGEKKVLEVIDTPITFAHMLAIFHDRLKNGGEAPSKLLDLQETTGVAYMTLKSVVDGMVEEKWLEHCLRRGYIKWHESVNEELVLEIQPDKKGQRFKVLKGFVLKPGTRVTLGLLADMYAAFLKGEPYDPEVVGGDAGELNLPMPNTDPNGTAGSSTSAPSDPTPPAPASPDAPPASDTTTPSHLPIKPIDLGDYDPEMETDATVKEEARTFIRGLLHHFHEHPDRTNMHRTLHHLGDNERSLSRAQRVWLFGASIFNRVNKQNADLRDTLEAAIAAMEKSDFEL